MSISFDTLRRVTNDKAPRVLIYGPPGIGKTTLASEFPDPVFIQVEEGTPAGVELTSWGLIESFGGVMDAVGALAETDHDLKTIVVDSVTALQRLVFSETCQPNNYNDNKGANNIEDFGYGKGYVYAQRVWQDFLDGLNYLRNKKDMAIVLLGHSKIERFDDPENSAYDRYEIDLHDKSKGLIEREMDAILLIKSPVAIEKEEHGFNNKRIIAKGDGAQRWVHTVGRPAFVAKNRYKLPSKFLYTEGKGFETMQPYFNWPREEPASAKSRKAQAENASA